MSSIRVSLTPCIFHRIKEPTDSFTRSRRLLLSSGRTTRYTIIEISMFEGRSVAAKETSNSHTF